MKPTAKKPIVQKSLMDDIVEEMGEDNHFVATYADLVTLLFAFFVMLYSMSDTDSGKFDGAASSLRTALSGRAQKPIPDAVHEGAALAEGVLEANPQVGELMVALQEQVSSDDVELLRDGDVIRIRVHDRMLFQSGSADLSTQAKELFQGFGSLLKSRPNFKIGIEGHTDDRPIYTERFPSNWELSAIRATTVLRQLIDQGIAAPRLTATGFGDLMPLVPNDSAKHRAKNRRVELVLEMEAQD